MRICPRCGLKDKAQVAATERYEKKRAKARRAARLRANQPASRYRNSAAAAD